MYGFNSEIARSAERLKTTAAERDAARAEVRGEDTSGVPILLMASEAE